MLMIELKEPKEKAENSDLNKDKGMDTLTAELKEPKEKDMDMLMVELKELKEKAESSDLNKDKAMLMVEPKAISEENLNIILKIFLKKDQNWGTQTDVDALLAHIDSSKQIL